MKLLIMSDIHGNLQALQSVMKDVECKYAIDGCVLTGDLIDYGMHSNEAIEVIKTLRYPLLCNIWGNHEHAIIREEYERFSSERGKRSAQYTKNCLNKASVGYIKNNMHPEGRMEFKIGDKFCLAVHGSLEDIYWKSISYDVDPKEYDKYDLVISGHSHLPHYFEKYLEADDPVMRNKRKIIFINSGSVGQPRNHNCCAQYVVFDTVSEETAFHKVSYDIATEQMAYHGQVDTFYKERLGLGI